MVIVYVIGKFILYSGVCSLAYRMFAINDRSELFFATSWGALRMLIGGAFIIPIFLLDAQIAEHGGTGFQSYVTSFGLMRVLEWLVLFGALMWQYKLRFERKAMLWICTGIAISFLSDGLAVITGASNIRLFC